MPNYDLILSRDSYLLSVELKVFWAVSFAYGLSTLIYLFHILTRSSSVGKAAQYLIWTTAFAHLALVIFRTVEAANAPFLTRYESLSFFAASATLTYLFMSRRSHGVYLPGFFVSALSAGACFHALFSTSPAVEPLSPSMQSYWFEFNAMMTYFSYAVFVVSASIEASCLIVRPLLKRGFTDVYGFNERMLEEFHTKAFKLIAFGFPLLTFAILSGAAWSSKALGSYWSWDPRQTWLLITWTVFAVYLHSRTIPSMKQTPASVINLVGFLCMILTFLGVNWLASLLGIPSLRI